MFILPGSTIFILVNSVMGFCFLQSGLVYFSRSIFFFRFAWNEFVPIGARIRRDAWHYLVQQSYSVFLLECYPSCLPGSLPDVASGPPQPQKPPGLDFLSFHGQWPSVSVDVPGAFSAYSPAVQFFLDLDFFEFAGWAWAS